LISSIVFGIILNYFSTSSIAFLSGTFNLLIINLNNIAMTEETYRVLIVCISSLAAAGTLTAAIVALYKLSKIFDQVDNSRKQIEISAIQTQALIDLNKLIYEQREIQLEREIKWQTEHAYEKYKTKTFNKITENIFLASNNGTDYTRIELSHDIICLINYLESIAVGIFQGIYNERMMFDFLKESVYKSVKVFLLGQSGEVKGRTWKAKKRIINPIEQPFLMELYYKWYPEEPEVAYRDPEKKNI
jgi:hypothetical protein